MNRSAAVAASAVHFAAAPGSVVVLVPWLLTRWEAASGPSYLLPLRLLGGVLIVMGVGVVAREFVRFVTEGGGSPAPVAPTASLVAGGSYARVRNPMYVAVTCAVLGQAMLLARWELVVYAVALFLVMWLFVRLYEEPALSRQHGRAYDEYRNAVPGWIPRLRSPHA